MQVLGRGRERIGQKGHHCPHTPQELGVSPAALGDELDQAVRWGRIEAGGAGRGGQAMPGTTGSRPSRALYKLSLLLSNILSQCSR